MQIDSTGMVLGEQEHFTPYTAWAFYQLFLAQRAQEPPQMVMPDIWLEKIGLIRDERAAQPIVGRLITRMIEEASVVLWKNEIFNAATQGSEGLVGVTADQFDTDTPAPQFWMVDKWVMIPNTGAFNPVGFFVDVWRGALVEVMLLLPEVGVPGSKLSLHMTTCLPFGAKIEAEHEARLYAAYLFLRQPFVSVEEDTKVISRQVRRAMERKNEIVPTLSVVHLRKAESRHAPGSDSGREYHCHWMVHGHWRKQWYRSDKVHRPKYVRPYVKGDTDLPFKAPRPTVYKVER